jgi:resuscitation-promoting factor RpfB
VAKPAPPVVASPPAGSGATAAEASFLACVRQRESGGNYSVVSSNGLWYGAYQMTRSTWNSAAQHAGRSDLVGVPPNQASPADQDYLALVLYRWLGKSPWGGAC